MCQFATSCSKVFGFLIAVFVLAGKAHAQIDLVHTGYKGTGCPANSVSVTLAPDNSAFSILFNQMDAQASGSRAEKRKSCEVFINLAIPKGMQLEFSSVDYRGFMDLSNTAAWGYLNSRAYFNNGWVIFPNGQIYKANDQFASILRFFKQGPLVDEFFWRADFDGKAQRVLSTCDGTAQVKVKTEVIASNGPEGGDAAITLDSFDANFSQTYKMFLRPCSMR